MSSEQPENLLKSALEKVVFFECRLEQLSRDLEGAEGERDRLKAELGGAAARELQLKQELAQRQGRCLAAERELDEARTREAAFKAERERWLTKMIEAERIRQGDAEPEGVDLASFIAELRAEIEALRSGRPVESGPRAPREAPAAAARRLAGEGRIGFTEADKSALAGAARFDSRAEQTVFAFSLRELSAPHPEARVRAAERLKALGTREAAAALAAALNAETEARVKPALIEALAATAGTEALPLLAPHLQSGDEPVRLAALEAAARLAGPRASEQVERALFDPSPRVRRRAALLCSALGAQVGAPLLARTTADEDASVRRVAALALASFGGDAARHALLAAAADRDPTVRRAACGGLSRLFGEPLHALADAPHPRRRRELRRLESAPLARPPAMGVAQPAAEPPSGLEEKLLSEVSTSLRGRSLEELSALGTGTAVVQTAAALVHQGKLVQRKERFFLA